MNSTRPFEFYNTFVAELIAALTVTCNAILETWEFPKTWHEACIVVFAKPGKDSSKVELYWPILLLNHDAKIFTSAMAF